MPTTYEPIATTTLSSANGTITFSSIPSTYTDLKIIGNFLSNGTEQLVALRFNNSSGASTLYSTIYMEADSAGATISSFQDTNSNYIEVGRTASTTTTYASCYVDVFQYTASIFRTALTTTANCDVATNNSRFMTNVGMYRDTTAVTRIDILLFTNTFSTGSTFTLYGIKAA